MRELLERICGGEHLTQAQSAAVFGSMVSGELQPVEISALLIGLRAKGEHPGEIAGAAQALLASATPFPSPGYPLADTCGTGGDGADTINVSTAAAFVAAELGVPVAKHGNRSVSSRCGSADVLERLGVDIEAAPATARRCLDETGVCFLYAPRYHAGLRHAMPVRRTLAVRTLMNLVGPLVNPAAPAFQVMGTADARLLVPLAFALGFIGRKAALVVHGSGLDEIAVHGPTSAALYRSGAVLEIDIAPEQAGLPRFPLDELRGGDPAENAGALAAVLGGRGAPAHAAAVAMNAGALLWIAGAAADLRGGVEAALAAIRSGRCLDRLRRMAEVSRGA
jgi:anthranilate phosphoribosyltransferase